MGSNYEDQAELSNQIIQEILDEEKSMKVGDRVRHIHSNNLGTIVTRSKMAPDVVRVLWDGQEADPFNENAVPVHVGSIIKSST